MSGPMTQRHRDGIAALVADGARTRYFARRVARLTGADVTGLPSFFPDAYKILGRPKRVVCYEVVVTSGIRSAKWATIRRWRDALKASGWSIVVLSGGGAGDWMEELDVDLERASDAALNERSDRVARLLGWKQ